MLVFLDQIVKTIKQNVSSIALVISLLALLFTYLNFRRKLGIKIRGGYSISANIECGDKYVSNVLLENLRDKSIAIYGIYLKVGHNYYIDIENMKENPIILKPFEVIKRNYGPIQCYCLNMLKINLNDLLSNNKASKKIVLSTNYGKYVVSGHFRIWSPFLDYLSNHLTIHINTIRLAINKHHIGSNVKYVIKIEGINGETEIIKILYGENEKKIRGVTIKVDALKTKEDLENFLEKEKIKIKNCKKITVYDVENAALELYVMSKKIKRDAKYCGLVNYYIVGKFYTWIYKINRLIQRIKKW